MQYDGASEVGDVQCTLSVHAGQGQQHPPGTAPVPIRAAPLELLRQFCACLRALLASEHTTSNLRSEVAHPSQRTVPHLNLRQSPVVGRIHERSKSCTETYAEACR